VQGIGRLYQMSVFRLCYGLACTLVEIFLPLLLLTVCNVCLIRALRRSYRMQVKYRSKAAFTPGYVAADTSIPDEQLVSGYKWIHVAVMQR